MINVSGKIENNKKKNIIENIINVFNVKEDVYGDAYIGYPVYSIEYTKEELICDLAIVSNYGFFIINIIDKEVLNYGKIQDDLYNKIESRLKRCSFLVNKRNLPFTINVCSYSMVNTEKIDDYPVFTNFNDINEYINDNLETIENQKVDMILSGLQEAQGLNRKNYHINANENSKALLIDEMNNIIEKYDCSQMNAIMEDPIGVQRIRGMAGSGKTVILARKAVELHIAHPEWTIVVTYYTRTLKNQLYSLIDKFYMTRNDGKHPDFTKVKVMHAWGSSSSDGLYYDICKNMEIKSYTYYEAKKKYPFASRPFDLLCEEVLNSGKVFTKQYDCILIDEAQDFNDSFLKLCCKVLGNENRLVYAYDELQRLNELSMESPEKIFGFNISKDTPLITCYRNQLRVIVTAHALGMGLYREEGMIQIPNSTDVWKSIGYKSDENIIEGRPVTLYRDKETSPDFLKADSSDLIKIDKFDDSNQVYLKLLESIKINITRDSLNPSDIMIIDLDGINAAANLSKIQLLINSNSDKYAGINIHQAGSANPEDFFRNDSIVYSTIFRAKGNEAYYVYILNAQRCIETLSITKDRNALFTAITRSKGWVRVYGYGNSMEKLCYEYEKVKENNYKLYFKKYPTESDREQMVILNKDISKNDSDALTNTKKFIDENQSNMEILLKELFGEKYKDRLRDFVVDDK